MPLDIDDINNLIALTQSERYAVEFVEKKIPGFDGGAAVGELAKLRGKLRMERDVLAEKLKKEAEEAKKNGDPEGRSGAVDGASGRTEGGDGPSGGSGGGVGA
jgi:hypothetical protein